MESADLAGISVFIVDDDPDMLEALQYLLESCGAEVTSANSAAEAFAVLERTEPDVLLSDIAMPGESGLDLMRKIGARRGRRPLPAAALSSFGTGSDRAQAAAAGFRKFVAKPIDPGPMIAIVAALAGRVLPPPGIPL